MAGFFVKYVVRDGSVVNTESWPNRRRAPPDKLFALWQINGHLSTRRKT